VSKAAILGSIRRSLGRDPKDGGAAHARLAERPRGLIPERSARDRAGQVDLFQEQAEAVNATVVRLKAAQDLPEAVADFLTRHNLPNEVRLAPHPELEALPWAETAPMLTVVAGKADPADHTSLTGAFAGVAETGTLMLHSGPQGPVTLTFLPENHLVVLKASQIVGSYEEAWSRVRAALGDGALPRTVNFVTGPSRTGDIEQTLQLGAHGPRRLHILLIEDEDPDDGAPTDASGTGPSGPGAEPGSA
jgi:L-lactate dehydrogenase complex protein LldG